MKVRHKEVNTARIGSELAVGKALFFQTPESKEPQQKESLQGQEFSFPVMMQSLGSSLEIVSVNRIWLDVLGYEESEVIGRKSADFLTESAQQSAVEFAVPKFLKAGSASDIVYQMVKKNGEVINVLLSAVTVRDADGQFLGNDCYIWDVNEQQRSDELFRQLSLVEERNRMSRDLHDTVEHSLIGIMLLTDTVREMMNSDPLTARSELESAYALAKVGLEQVRLAVWNLQPLAITSNPLRDIITRGLSRLEEEGIKTSLAVDGDEPLGIDQRNKLAVIRIVQEVLSNIRVHSHAGMAKVSLSYTQSHLELLITDDGVGFDPTTTHSALSPTSHGIGLANMRESARLAGGSVWVRSAPGSGTQVEVRVPFSRDSENDSSLLERSADEKLPNLTNREQEILRILANGGRNKDIAAEMFVSIRTVKFHIENLYKKLAVRTRAELIRVATLRGFLEV